MQEKEVLKGKEALVKRFFPEVRAFTAGLLAPPRVKEYAPRANVVGVGVAEKVTQGRLTGVLSVRIYVRVKGTEGEVGRRDKLPRSVNGVPVDVVETGDIAASSGKNCDPRTRLRPAPGGVSCGHAKSTAGTLGCLVKGPRGKGLYALSNNHVMALCNEAEEGDPILQPGPLDGGTPKDRLGELARFLPLELGENANRWDAALAAVNKEDVTAEILLLGVPKGAVKPRRGMAVIKNGRTTGKTQGVVEDVHADIWVDYRPHGYAGFQNAMAIRGSGLTPLFSAGGDSGSVILEETSRKACGLLFAGSRAFTFSTAMAPLLKALRVKLVTEWEANP